jgi:hypothetical protein
MFFLMSVPSLEALLKVIGGASWQNLGHRVSGHPDDLDFLIALSSCLLGHRVVIWIFEEEIALGELGRDQMET